MNQKIASSIRGTGFSQFILSIVLLAITAVIAASNPSGLKNLFGAEKISLTDVEDWSALENRKVTFDVEEWYDTEYVEEVDGANDDEILFVTSGDFGILVFEPYLEDGAYEVQTVSGYLIDADPSMYADLSGQIADAGFNTVEYMVDPEAEVGSDTFGFLCALGIFGIWGLIAFVIGIVRIVTPLGTSSFVKNANGRPTDEWAAEANAELEEGAVRISRSVTMTRSFLIMRRLFQFRMADFRDVLWAHKKVTRQKLYGIVTVAKNFTLVLYLKNGRKVEIPMKEKQADLVLVALDARPEAPVTGYSNELQAFWAKDRSFFHAVIAQKAEQRRAGAQSPSSAEA